MNPNRLPARLVLSGLLLLGPGLVAGCGDDDGTPAATTEVVIETLHSFGGPAHAARGPAPAHENPRTFVSSTGYTIHLQKCYVTLSGMELHPVDDHGAPARVGDDGLRPAHGSEDLVIEGSQVAPILDHDLDPIEFGRMDVPEGSYHGLDVTLAPAHAATEGLPTSVDMVGRTLYLEGTATLGEATFPFVYSWNGTVDVEVAFISPSGGHEGSPAALRPAHAEAPLDIAGDAPFVIRVGKECHHWLDGVDFAAMSADQQRDQVVANVQASLHHFTDEIPVEE